MPYGPSRKQVLPKEETIVRRNILCTVILAILVLFHATVSRSQTNAFLPYSNACEELKTLNFAMTRDAPTQVTDSHLVVPASGAASYCLVHGYVIPQVGIELLLPTSGWNGKFLELGCGGFCGFVQTAKCEAVLRRGYACLSSNLGHNGSGMDELWAYDNNLSALVDFGFRGAHVAALAGKAIAARYYAKAPSKSYFMGCSSGGMEALSEAQRYPWDFDGIIAGAPSPYFLDLVFGYEWAGRALLDKSGKLILTQVELHTLHNAVLAKCDMDDGVKDGVISDPLHCKFDPAELLCKRSQHADCLTAEQVEAVKKVYSGPVTSTGYKPYTGGPLPGSELSWVDGGASEPYAYSSSNLQNVNAADTIFRYFAFVPPAGAGWKASDLDFENDFKRFGTVESIVGAGNPDLRKFKAAGGKLLLYQGLQDHSDIPRDAIDYYEMTERVMGGRAATQEFFRLFAVPGMNHCTGGPGPFAVDYLSALEAWVEQGHAPDVLVGYHVPDLTWEQAYHLTGNSPLDPSVKDRADFTRPIYPFPVRAVYKGAGDPTKAENFRPTEQ
jgi:hypothetical protein